MHHGPDIIGKVGKERGDLHPVVRREVFGCKSNHFEAIGEYAGAVSDGLKSKLRVKGEVAYVVGGM